MRSMLALALLSAVAVAQDGVGNGPQFTPFPVSNVTAYAAKIYFDCEEGNNNMVIRAVDAWGNQEKKGVYVGSYKACLEQAKPLRAAHKTITEPTTVAVCSTGPTTLFRYVAYPSLVTDWNGWLQTTYRRLIVPAGNFLYQTKAACLEYANELNSKVAE